jgi:hypothetical protein
MEAVLAQFGRPPRTRTRYRRLDANPRVAPGPLPSIGKLEPLLAEIVRDNPCSSRYREGFRGFRPFEEFLRIGKTRWEPYQQAEAH